MSGVNRARERNGRPRRGGNFLLTALVTAGCVVAACGSPSPSATAPSASAPTSSVDPATAAKIKQILDSSMSTDHVRALIARVVVDGKTVFMGAQGESMTGVPATADMHFRNGAVAFSYIGEILAIMADRKQISLDDPVARWMPQLPESNRITLRMLANMTSGYADYVYQPELNGILTNPFRQWTNDELIQIGISKPMDFEPGKNWGYSHTNYVILAKVLEKITGKPLATVMQDYVFGPMGLQNTRVYLTPEIQAPVLHTYSSERRVFLGIPATTPFIEESTFWNPSWTTAAGAVQTTDITDMATSIQVIGSGSLVSPETYRQQVGNNLVGLGGPTPACSVCRKIEPDFGYGLGDVLLGEWIIQSKLFAGSGGTTGYLPAKKITIAVAATLTAAGFDNQGNDKDPSQPIFKALAGLLAPGVSFGPK